MYASVRMSGTCIGHIMSASYSKWFNGRCMVYIKMIELMAMFVVRLARGWRSSEAASTIKLSSLEY
ncbi:hypothetical protein F383_11003 [Gossypium arboreum]|uniref:Uncharacterized protein n=1 Tax=Gossypium arboreum TaxID=29729 RepID=A0A0B0NH05_GOSAR|nr:hypothetical protein F383_11003 [Gossypium arboreum]